MRHLPQEPDRVYYIIATVSPLDSPGAADNVRPDLLPKSRAIATTAPRNHPLITFPGQPACDPYSLQAMTEVTLMLEAVDRGEASASTDLLPLVYNELRRHAAGRMAHEAAGQTMQPTALVHEAWLRMVGHGDGHWQNRAHFFGAAVEAMRRILIENARRKARLKRGGNPLRCDLDHVELSATTPDEKVLLIDDAIERLQLEDPEKAQVVVLKFFVGLTNQEVAENIGVTERTVERHWAYAKAWLFQSIRAGD